MNKSPPRRLFGVHTWVLVLFVAIAVFTIGLFASNGAGTAEAATADPVIADTIAMAPTDSTALLSAEAGGTAYSTTDIDVTAAAGTSTPAEVDASGGSGEIAILSDILIINPTTSQTATLAATTIFAAILLGTWMLLLRHRTQHRGRLLQVSARDDPTIYGEDTDYSLVTSRAIGLHTGRVALNPSLVDAFFDRLRGTGPEWTSATLVPT